MSIKRKYLLLNRIAVICAVVMGYYAGSDRGGDKYNVCKWIMVLITIFISILDYQKRNAIRRQFGILKVINENDDWLDMDGLRHAKYTEVLDSRLEKYYADGGESFGHCFEFIGRLLYIFVSVIACAAIILALGDDYPIDLPLSIAILASVYWFYVLVRKVIIG